MNLSDQTLGVLIGAIITLMAAVLNHLAQLWRDRQMHRLDLEKERARALLNYEMEQRRLQDDAKRRRIEQARHFHELQPRPVFNGLDLSGAALNGVDLRGASLSGADLSGAHLRQACLAHANLEGANCTGADFQNADLQSANLCDANLTGANLTGAILIDAGLERARLPDGSGILGVDHSGG